MSLGYVKHLPWEVQFHLKQNSFIDFTQFGDIQNLIFNGDVNFKRCVFNDNAVFTGIHFKGIANFYGAVFSGKAVFERARFLVQADFDMAEFKKNAEFFNVYSKNEMRFNDSKIIGKANFDNFSSDGNVSFNRRIFGSTAIYTNAQFKGKSYFQGARFKDVANFNQAHFEQASYFNKKTMFENNAIFNNTTFKNSVIFNQSILKSNFDFNDAKINGHCRFEDCVFENTNFNNIKVDGNCSFRGSHFLNKTVFNQINFGLFCNFNNVKFKDEVKYHFVNFKKAIFEGVELRENVNFYKINVEYECHFTKAQIFKELNFEHSFFSDNLYFNRALIDGTLNFLLTTHKKHFFFVGNKIEPGAFILLEDINLNEKSYFYFKSPILKKTNKISNTAVVKFKNIQFNHFKTFFEDFKLKESTFPPCIVAFRYCDLKDTFFSDNAMLFFSFYKSTFDEARFFTNEWGQEKYKWCKVIKRKNIIVDECSASDGIGLPRVNV